MEWFPPPELTRTLVSTTDPHCHSDPNKADGRQEWPDPGGHRGGEKADVNDVNRMHRAEKVWAFRLAGLTHRQIADKLNISDDTGRRDIDRIKIEYPTQNVRELIAEQNDKLAQMMKPQFFKAIGGDRRAVDAMIKMMDHQAKLFGLYDVTDDNGQADVMAAFRAIGEAIRGKAAE